jgi:hypothetical protein
MPPPVPPQDAPRGAARSEPSVPTEPALPPLPPFVPYQGTSAPPQVAPAVPQS